MKTADDIALIREARRTAARQPRMLITDELREPDEPIARTPRQRRNEPAGKRGNKAPVDDGAADRRRRTILGVLLVTFSTLLVLAIISYARVDQANAEIKPGELVGVFTGDDAVRVKFDVTQNWLGLLGAMVANFFILGTVGWFSLAVPALIATWGVALIRNTADRKLAIITSYVLLGATMLATFVGTLQHMWWFQGIPGELSGGIGQFLSTVLSRLIGTAGAAVLLAGTGLVLFIVAFDHDLHRTMLRVKLLIDTMKDKLADAKARRAEAAEEKAAAAGSVKEAPVATASIEDEYDEEPARVVRKQQRMTLKPEEPKIRRPAIAKQPPPPLPTQLVIPINESPVFNDDAKKRFVEQQNDDGPAATTPPVATPEPVQDVVNDTPVAEAIPAAADAAVDAGVDESDEKPGLTLRVQETEAVEEVEEGTVADFEDGDEEIDYTPPAIDLLAPGEIETATITDEELKEHAHILQQKLATFNVIIEDVQVTPGPVVTLYEFVPAAGIKIAQIENLQDDIALAMKARGIRIIAPIPGKGTVGVEIPNDKAATVRLRNLIGAPVFRDSTAALPLALGMTTIGEPMPADLATMPHLLIAGATGSGKSVGINSMILSILYKRHPSDVKFIIVDPKKIELSIYRQLRNHFLAVCPDVNEDIITTPQNAVIALKSVELEMERRYDLLAKAGVRHLTDYNERIVSGRLKSTPASPHKKLPYLVVVIDELADLMITAAHEVEEPIARLAQLARAVGIHLLVATQRPSVDVITGVIKANFSSRIAYAVASRIDSRTILDGSGAEQLLGRGDMLFLNSNSPKPIRLQNPLVTTEEIDAVVGYISAQPGYRHPYMLPSVVDKKRSTAAASSGGRDELFDEAARLVVRHQQGSVSLLQRRLKVGYSRAARLVDELEMAGIVGPFDGSKARQVLIDDEETLEAQL